MTASNEAGFGGMRIWNHMPHPAQAKASGQIGDGKTDGTVDVVVSDAFWQRVAQHASADEPRRWEALLTAQGAREVGAGGSSWAQRAAGTQVVAARPAVERPVAAERALRAALHAALAEPCVMVRRERDDARPVWYALLRGGACVVLSFDEKQAHAEDCFFPARTEQCDDPRSRQLCVLHEMVLRYCPYDGGSRSFVVHRAPPQRGAGARTGAGAGESPVTWFLAPDSLLPDPSLPLETAITPADANPPAPPAPPAPAAGSTAPAYLSFIAVADADAECEMESELTPASAYRVLVKYGQAKLFGAGDAAEVPAADIALLACSALLSRLRRWECDSRRTTDQWRDASSAFRDELRLRLIEQRTEAWAAGIAVEDAYHDSLGEESSVCDALSRVIDDVLNAFDAFDHTIDALAPLLLATWSPTDRDRWRSMLAAPYRDSQLPWLACDKS